MLRIKKAGIVVASAAVTATMFTPVYASAQTGGEQCSAVHIITAKGTGGSSESEGHENPSDVQGDVVRAAKEAFPGKVSSYDVSYPSGAGAVYSINPVQDNSTTYGYSRLKGDMDALEHIRDYKAMCPDTMLAFTGFSQGASVMGDVTALVANGAVEGVGPDDILGAILVADPGRSGNSQYSGPPEGSKHWIPLPQGGVYQRNGEVANVPADVDTVGWTGQRSLPFTGIEGRVISLCSTSDLACSVGIGSPHRDVADMSDKDIFPNESYRNGPSMFNILANDMGVMLPILVDLLGPLATQNDYEPLMESAKQKIANSNMTEIKKGVAYNFFDEISRILEIVKQPDLYGDQVTDRQIVSHALSVFYPKFKEKIPNADQVLPILDPVVQGLLASGNLPQDVKDRVDPFINYIANFGTEHGSYYTGKNQTDGVASGVWAQNAMVEGIRNYLNGNELMSGVAPAADAREPEIAEPDRADDGLRAMLRYLDEGESVLDDGENTIPDDDSNPPSTDDSDYGDNSDSSSGSYVTRETETDDEDGDSTPSTGSVESPVISANTASTEKYGPVVNTGGEVEKSFLAKVSSWFR